MEPREYVIKAVKKGKLWRNSYGEFQAYGLAIQGIGEPVKLNKAMPVDTDPCPGDVLYGCLIEDKATDGRVYLRFKAEQRGGIVKEKSVSLRSAEWAIRLAFESWISRGAITEDYSEIAAEAQYFLDMRKELKGE